MKDNNEAKPVSIPQVMNSKSFKFILVFVTFIAILVTGIVFKQQFIKLLPLFISLYVMLFQANANRYAYIIGALNCVLYTYVYIHLGLYASAASSMFFSFPIQILTFFNWRKHAYKKSVVFKKMNNKTRILLSALLIVVWVMVFLVLKLLNSNYAILDNTVSLLGILVSVLTMLAYIEYSYIWIIVILLNTLLNAQIALNNPEYITYFIYSVYCLICTIIALINVMNLYKSQQNERE